MGELGVGLSNGMQAFCIKRQYIIVHYPRKSLSDEYGPDIAFIEILDQSKIETIHAIKSFWEISSQNYETCVRACSSNSKYLWAIAGIPEASLTEEPPQGGFNQVSGLQHQIYFGGARESFEKNGIDYIEIDANYSTDTKIPESFGGISGGGLWTIPVKNNTNNIEELVFADPVLAGLVFYQTEKANDIRRLRCHGPKFLYSSIIEEMEKRRP